MVTLWREETRGDVDNEFVEIMVKVPGDSVNSGRLYMAKLKESY